MEGELEIDSGGVGATEVTSFHPLLFELYECVLDVLEIHKNEESKETENSQVLVDGFSQAVLKLLGTLEAIFRRGLKELKRSFWDSDTLCALIKEISTKEVLVKIRSCNRQNSSLGDSKGFVLAWLVVALNEGISVDYLYFFAQNAGFLQYQNSPVRLTVNNLFFLL